MNLGLPNLHRAEAGQGCSRCACHTFIETEHGTACAACGAPMPKAGHAGGYIMVETEFIHLRCEGCGVGWNVAVEPIPWSELLAKVRTFQQEHANCAERLRRDSS